MILIRLLELSILKSDWAGFIIDGLALPGFSYILGSIFDSQLLRRNPGWCDEHLY